MKKRKDRSEHSRFCDGTPSFRMPERGASQPSQPAETGANGAESLADFGLRIPIPHRRSAGVATSWVHARSKGLNPFIVEEISWVLADFSTPEPNTGCYLWTGRVQRGGHGVFCHRGEQRLAHRAAYELRWGCIPRGLHVHHVCLQHSCVNPEHLVALTPRQHRNVHNGTGAILTLPIDQPPPPGAIPLDPVAT